jgi:uncharacterized CHY-type Zn-finger protein
MLPTVSVTENQTLSGHLKGHVDEENEENVDFHEPYKKMGDQKSIAKVQICLHCGRKLPLKNGRKNCPYCQSLLRTRTIIIKVPQF